MTEVVLPRIVCECGSSFKNYKRTPKNLQVHLVSDRHKILMKGGSVDIHDRIVACRDNITGYKSRMQKEEEGTKSWNGLNENLKRNQAELQDLESKWLNIDC